MHNAQCACAMTCAEGRRRPEKVMRPPHWEKCTPQNDQQRQIFSNKKGGIDGQKEGQRSSLLFGGRT